ncbi:pentapeptide repeat-containing protein [Ancylothrix sp. D3o]|uniref:pentapeptide repeat-containing protein n=1 Tax=Ancylothrix sp. D3o TaxID=2953691 RepID=UPI0021BAC381|nr:pentapeptide repeat-containing protein [Ancylothrix sp. D3o]
MLIVMIAITISSQDKIWGDTIIFCLGIVLNNLGIYLTTWIFVFTAINSGIYGKLAALFLHEFTTINLIFIYTDHSIKLKILTFILSVGVTLTGIIIAHKAIKGDPKFAWIKEKAIFWAATGGTSFYGVDLTDVCFDNSHLPHTDFRNTILTRTSFKNVTGLELSRLQGTILEDPKVRRLLTHPQEGWKGNFSHANLKGANLIQANLTLASLKKAHLTDSELTDILLSEANLTDANLTNANLTGANLEGANLTDANLINANLTGANLEGANLNCANLNGANLTNANLEGANLTKAQVLDANFSGANLTDACIKDWSINSGTIFTDITCKRIYLKQGKHGFLDPKPDNGEFQPGDFEKWIYKLNETIDIIIHQKLNWNALTVALGKTLVEQEGLDGSWSVQKTDDLYIAKVGVTANAHKQAIHQSITNYYHTEVAIQGEKANILLNPAKEVDIMESKKEGINVGGNMTIGGDNMTLTGASIIGDLNNVTNTIQQLQDIKTEKTEDLVKILTNLKDSIANDNQLTEPQKKEALEAVQTIAEEAKKPAPERTLKYCTMALNALKGITSAVTDASKLAEVFKTCLPTLTTLLGL